VIPELKVSKGFKLQPYISIFMCELTAIFLALNWIQDFKPLNTVIFVPTWLGIHSKITFIPILFSDVKILYIS
jgi:hypothetical protein